MANGDDGVKGWVQGRSGCAWRYEAWGKVCKEWRWAVTRLGAERELCAEMCEGWGKGREEWERGVVSGGEGVKGWGRGY